MHFRRDAHAECAAIALHGQRNRSQFTSIFHVFDGGSYYLADAGKRSLGRGREPGKRGKLCTEADVLSILYGPGHTVGVLVVFGTSSNSECGLHPQFLPVV